METSSDRFPVRKDSRGFLTGCHLVLHAPQMERFYGNLQPDTCNRHRPKGPDMTHCINLLEVDKSQHTEPFG